MAAVPFDTDPSASPQAPVPGPSGGEVGDSEIGLGVAVTTTVMTRTGGSRASP